MRKAISLAACLLVLSCSQKPEKVTQTRLPLEFPVQGFVSVERYTYGGAAGGYRYYVYGVNSRDERTVLYKGKSNKVLSLSFPKDGAILIDLCGSTLHPRRTTVLADWQGLPVKKLC
jgi:hypothetical protein